MVWPEAIGSTPWGAWSRAMSRTFGLETAAVAHGMIAAPTGTEFDEETERYADHEPTGQGAVLERGYPPLRPGAGGGGP